MPKRSSKDTNQTAFSVVQIATQQKFRSAIKRGARSNASASATAPALPLQEWTKNPAAVALGKLGGIKGGKARAAKLSSEQRKAIAKKGAAARWEKNKPGEG